MDKHLKTKITAVPALPGIYQFLNKDRKIIEILKADSRSSVRSIAKSTGIRPSTVHQRIQKLVKEGVIERFTLKLNNKEVDENFIVFILANTSKDLQDKFIHDKHVKEVFGVTGEYDLMLKLKFSSVDEFNKFILEFRKEQSV